MKHSLTVPEVQEILDKVGSKEWNEAISCRLESLRGYLAQDEWQKGISIHLKAIQGHAMVKLLGESLTQDANNYLRGLIAGLKIATSLPASVEAAIAGESSKTKGGPKGDAGY
jgi:hypothetical protein